MPEMRRYKVTQVREVFVKANTATTATQIAEAAFEHGQNQDGSVKIGKGPEGIWGNTTSHIREIELDTKEVTPSEH